MPIKLDLINILILIVGILNLSLGMFIFLTKRESKINRSFFLFSLAAMGWSISMFLFRSSDNSLYSPLFSRILYVSASTIPFVFLFLIRVFPEEKYGIPKKIIALLSLPFLYVVAISILPGYLISGTVHVPGQEQIIVFDTFYHTIYAFYIITYFSICYLLLFIKYFKYKEVEKLQIWYVILGTFVSTIIGVSTNLILPYLSDFHLNWLGQIGIIAMVGSISYSILQHRLFDMKVVSTQFIVFILCTSLFARMLFSSGQSDLIINGIFFLISVIIGILLIKSVLNEVEQRQRLELLTKNLENVNNSLASANNRLKELDQLKSEFLSLATHQIRAPLTAIKGYASLVLEGDFGALSEKMRPAVQTIFDSCENLVVIVGEFLDISRIEQGRMKYDVADFDLKALIEKSIRSLMPTFQNAHLSLSFSADAGDAYTAHADSGKLQQVIGNIIDNAIKYTPHGGVEITLSHKGKKNLIAIKDTGIGISKDDIPKLFGKFVRAKDANRTNVIGTGLGLYVAKQMIEAQGGKVWVDSDGLGRGSTFYIEI